MEIAGAPAREGEGHGAVSYSGRAEGEIRIDPPLNYREIKQWPEVLKAAGSRNGWAPVKLEQESQVTESDEGTSTVVTCKSVVIVHEYSFDGLNTLPAYLAALMGVYGSSHRITGYFECLMEDGERWRAGIDSTGEVFEHRPQYVWPEIP